MPIRRFRRGQSVRINQLEKWIRARRRGGRRVIKYVRPTLPSIPESRKLFD